MDWKQIAPIVGAIAPTAGQILGGFIPFPGGSLIGEGLGKLIAQQLGVEPTPDTVSTALQNTEHDVALAKINSALDLARAQINGFVEYEKAVLAAVQASAEQVNQTMRILDLPQNRHWFFTGWRAAAGWVLVFFMLCLGFLILSATGKTVLGDSQVLTALSSAWPLYLSYVGVLAALVGVVISPPRDKMQIELPQAAPPPPGHSSQEAVASCSRRRSG